MCPNHHLILVVDDDHAIRESLTELLQDEGYHVAIATNGQEALEVLAQGGDQPCLILLDLMMPVMDGFEFIGRKTADPSLAKIPVVVITAAGPRPEGAEDDPASPLILAKPVQAETLITTVKQYC